MPESSGIAIPFLYLCLLRIGIYQKLSGIAIPNIRLAKSGFHRHRVSKGPATPCHEHLDAGRVQTAKATSRKKENRKSGDETKKREEGSKTVLQQVHEESIREKGKAATEGLIAKKEERFGNYCVKVMPMEKEDDDDVEMMEVEIVPRLNIAMEMEEDFMKQEGEGHGDVTGEGCGWSQCLILLCDQEGNL